MVEWVEVRGKSIEVAVEAAMTELGVSDRARIDVEIIQEPEKGFLGMGGRDAIVRVKPKTEPERRRRRPRGRGEAEGANRRPRNQEGNRQRSDRQPSRSGVPARGNGGGQRTGGNRSSGGRDGGTRPRPAPESSGPVERPRREERVSTADPQAQAPIVAEFLEGLVESFGLEGQVDVQVQEDVIVAVVSGEQTEALVGTRGSVMEAIHEITKTVLHRQAGDTARVRLDVAGYAERRRQALSIYAGQLINQVLSEGGEIMLEPMSAADRKVIHDAVAAHQGVRSYSEGEAPRRYVVIAATDEDEGEGPEPESDVADIESDEAPLADESDNEDE